MKTYTSISALILYAYHAYVMDHFLTGEPRSSPGKELEANGKSPRPERSGATNCERFGTKDQQTNHRGSNTIRIWWTDHDRSMFGFIFWFVFMISLSNHCLHLLIFCHAPSHIRMINAKSENVWCFFQRPSSYYYWLLWWYLSVGFWWIMFVEFAMCRTLDSESVDGWADFLEAETCHNIPIFMHLSKYISTYWCFKLSQLWSRSRCFIDVINQRCPKIRWPLPPFSFGVPPILLPTKKPSHRTAVFVV